jgi:hypothetical protein
MSPRPGRRITLVATLKNEGPYILEWLAYHRMIGFTDFVLFSNDCTDGTNLILNRLDTMGVLRHHDNPLGPGMDPQRAAYSRAAKLGEVQNSDWGAVLDADEFLSVTTGDGSVDALIDACPGADAISVNWRIMGSNGAARREDAPVTRRFALGADLDTPANGLVWGFKTLFRPAAFDYFGVHRPRFFKDREIAPNMVAWVNGAGADMGDAYFAKGWRSNADRLGYSLATVHHYATKSREEFLLKRLRGTANSKNRERLDWGYWDKFDLNERPAPVIRTAGLEDAMDALACDADLAALLRACADSVARTLDYLMQHPPLRAFVETGQIVPPAPGTGEDEGNARKQARQKDSAERARRRKDKAANETSAA